MQNEAIVELICGDIVDDDAALVAALVTLRNELDDQEGRLGTRLIAAQRAWIDEVERTLRARAAAPQASGR